MAHIPQVLNQDTCLDNTRDASIDYDADFVTQIDQSLAIKNLIRIVINRSNALNIVLVERNIEQSHLPVFRWSSLPPSKIFVEGFEAFEQVNTDLRTYTDYVYHIFNGAPPLSTTSQGLSRVFVATSQNFYWIPPKKPSANVYRYRIFAPGGIVAKATLPEGPTKYPYGRVEEVSFIKSIKPCYIHSACLYELEGKWSAAGRNITTISDLSPVNGVHYVNTLFSPGPILSRGKFDQIHSEIPYDMTCALPYPPQS